MSFASLHIKVAKWLDEYLGRALIALVRSLRLGRRGKNEPTATQCMLVIKFWGMGSIILLEPALRLLREHYPHTRIDFLTLKQNRELFALLPQVERMHVLDFRHPLWFLLRACAMLVYLRRQQYQIIFDAEFFAHFSGLLARLAAPKKVIGFSRPRGHKLELLDVAVPFHDDEHAVHNFIRLISAEFEAKPAEHKALASNSMSPRINLSTLTNECGREPYVVMNVNASPLALERRWPQENFVQLAQWLVRRYEVKILLIGNSAERKYTQHLADKMNLPARVVNLAGVLKLRGLAELIHHAALFISNDSGPLHLAAALQKPVVGFYGPETPKRFGPLCEKRLVFYLGLSCSPCMSVDNAKTVNCTNQLRCMQELRMPEVIGALQRFIAQYELLPLHETQNRDLPVVAFGAPSYAV